MFIIPLYSDERLTAEMSVKNHSFLYTVFNLPLTIIIHILHTDAAHLLSSSISSVYYMCITKILLLRISVYKSLYNFSKVMKQNIIVSVY
jgi:hypothetical protein